MEKWDKRFCELAKFVSEWSKDPKAQVGAVLVSRRGGDITVGYNGLPMGVHDRDERLHDKDKKLAMIVHAEVNAVLAAGLRAQASTVYVWGKPVCSRCAGAMIQAGVRRVVAMDPETETSETWRDSGRIAIEMFREARIAVEFYKAEDLAVKSEPG
jgi:dCMP deaminase